MHSGRVAAIEESTVAHMSLPYALAQRTMCHACAVHLAACILQIARILTEMVLWVPCQSGRHRIVYICRLLHQCSVNTCSPPWVQYTAESARPSDVSARKLLQNEDTALQVGSLLIEACFQTQ